MPATNQFRAKRQVGLPTRAAAAIAERRADRESVPLIPVAAPAEDGSAGTTVFAELDPKDLADNPRNDPSNDPRRTDDLSDLASVETYGVLQPLLVTPSSVFLAAFPQHSKEIGGKRYVILAGHRRNKKAKQVGHPKVPVYIRTDMSADGRDAVVRVIENLQRRGLNPIAEALEYQRMRDENGMGVREIGAATGFAHGQISKRLKLLNLPGPLQAAVVTGAMKVTDASKLLDDAKTPELMLAAWELMRDMEMPVAQAIVEAPKHRDRGTDSDRPKRKPPTTPAPPGAAPHQEAAAGRYAVCEQLAAATPDPSEAIKVLARHSISGAPGHRDALRLAQRWLIAHAIGPTDIKDPGAYMAAVKAEDLVHVAYVVALASDEVRARDPRRAWDARDIAHLQRLQAAGYTPTSWEQDRMAAATQ